MSLQFGCNGINTQSITTTNDYAAELDVTTTTIVYTTNVEMDLARSRATDRQLAYTTTPHNASWLQWSLAFKRMRQLNSKYDI